ncbi:hypothetical protein IFT59_02810 [Rhizobium sp. CFBP 8752]|nr:hypothetical protein [Rhizobium sp. CFBP 8752]
MKILIRPQHFAEVQFQRIEQIEIDRYHFASPASAMTGPSLFVMGEQACSQAVAMVVESDSAIRHIDMRPRKSIRRNNPFRIKTRDGRVKQIGTGQNMACSMPEENSVGQHPTTHGVFLDAAFQDVHSASMT